jgi:hypothetical protein
MSLDGRYTVSDMLSVLNASLDKGTDLRVSTVSDQYSYPYFYQGTDPSTIVFAPVTDNPDARIGLESIEGMLGQAKRYCDDQGVSLGDKKMVFPLVEMQPVLGFLAPRHHFVTVHYDPSTRTATVVDSRPWWAALGYSLDAIKKSLRSGLSAFDSSLSLDKIEVHYQAVQHNDSDCGAWVAANIQAFASGQSLQDRALTCYKDNVAEITQRQINAVNKPPRQASFVPDSLDESLDEADDFLIYSPTTRIEPTLIQPTPVLFFTTEQKARWEQEALAHFRLYFENKNLLWKAILANQGVKLNGTIVTEHQLRQLSDVRIILLAVYNQSRVVSDNVVSGDLIENQPLNRGYELVQPEYSDTLLECMTPLVETELRVYESLILKTILIEVSKRLSECLVRDTMFSEDELVRANDEMVLLKSNIGINLINVFKNDYLGGDLMNPSGGGEEECKLGEDGLVFSSGSVSVASEYQSVDLTTSLKPVSPEPLTADFQLNCIHALLIAGGILLAIAVLTCPPVAGAVGLTVLIGGALSTSLSTGSAVAGATAILASAGLFAVKSCSEVASLVPDSKPAP